jgi:hypothetical protein
MLTATDKTDAKSGNIELQISTGNLTSRVITTFRWAVSINGVEYSSLSLEYQNGDFHALYDNRGTSKIGNNTEVNISQEQAVELALQYKQTYSYKAITGPRDNPQAVDVYVGGFNVFMERISCKLFAYPDESSLLGPCYLLTLPLETNTTLWALSVVVNAVSGEIVKCQPMILEVVGDWSIVDTGTDSYSSSKTSAKTSSLTYTDAIKTLNLYDSDKISSEDLSVNNQSTEAMRGVSVDFGMLALIAVGLTAIIAVPVAILAVKKRNK